MKQAIVEVAGKQVRVSEGQIVPLRLASKADERVELTCVLLVSNGKKDIVGTPYVEGANVRGKIVRRAKGKKVTVETYKAKSHYHRKLGFRPLISFVQIEKIQEPR